MTRSLLSLGELELLRRPPRLWEAFSRRIYGYIKAVPPSVACRLCMKVARGATHFAVAENSGRTPGMNMILL